MKNSLCRLVVAFFLVWLLMHETSGLAYELRTHERITSRAFDISQGVAVYLNGLGIALSDIFDFKSRTLPRQLADFDNTGTLRDWMIEGAIREDDFKPHTGCDQPRNPPSEIDRPLHHFFDVQRGGGGLRVLGAQRGFSTLDWAMGKQGRGPGVTQNHFSILDARVYQLQSFTEPKKEDREQNTALLFRTLGQVAHLLQDMAQPQHSRNDPHAGCISESLTGEHSWYENYIEKRALGQRFRTRGQPAPPLLLDGYPLAYFASYEEFWTTAGKQGLADFSSRNFFSAGTNLPTCGGLNKTSNEPACDLDAYTSRDTEFALQTVKNTTVAGQVKLLLSQVQDHLTGATLPNVAVSSYSLWDQHLERLGRSAMFSLNTLNYDAMSNLLLPRAVGYTTGLLDYFFRGKIEVDLSADPVDPSILHVEGTNASPEPLDGILSVYADDPDGNRVKVSTDFPLVAAAGQEVASPTFQLTEAAQEAERFVAVYQGTLGKEVKDQEANFSGAVIGKVLGGVRVEQVFSDGTRWQLRTPKGIFALPILAQEVKELRWGDRDNTLVGRSQLGQGKPNQFYAYEINRPVGSLEVPLKTLYQPDGSQLAVVDVQVRQQVPFPFGLDTGTTIRFGHTLKYKQYWPSVLRKETLSYSEKFSTYIETDLSYEGQWHLVVDTSPVLQRDYPVILVADLMTSGLIFPSPYYWEVVEMSLTADGRILAVVRVQFHPQEETTVPTFALADDGSLRPLDPVTLRFYSPFIGPALWALVDVGNGGVLASTAPQTLEINHQTAQTNLHPIHLVVRYGLTGVLEQKYVGGDLNGIVKRSGWGGGRFVEYCTPEQVRQMEVFAEVSVHSGTLQATVSQYRPELASLLPRSIEPTPQVVHLLPIDCGRAGVPGAGFKVTVSSTAQSGNTLEQVRRPKPGASPEALVLLMQLQEPLSEFPHQGLVVQWIPEESNAALKQALAEPGFSGFHTIRSVSHSSVLVDSFLLSRQFGGLDLQFSGTLIPLQSTSVTSIFPDQSFFDFVVLEPAWLYNVKDLKFYSKDPSPKRTVLPATLAPVKGFTGGDYHLLTVQ